MRKFRYLSILLALLLATNVSLAQQRDSRNRLASTVIADALTQMPAQTSDKYNQLMGEMAATGAEGVEMLVGMLIQTIGNDIVYYFLKLILVSGHILLFLNVYLLF